MGRLLSNTINEQEIKYPLFFPSISSFKVHYSPLDYLKIIDESGIGYFLISAYDVYNTIKEQGDEIISILKAMKDRGVKILLDSGNYESYWFRDTNWNIDCHNEVLTYDIATFGFSFDCQSYKQYSDTELIDLIVENTTINSQYRSTVIGPIIHTKTDKLPDICREVSKQLKPAFIAVPERLLGHGILARCQTLNQIRTTLNDTLGYYMPIHVLGTGNPYSILLLSFAGGDTFDGLEWCQTSVDEKTYQVYHFQLRELYDTGIFGITDYDVNTLCRNLYAYQKINGDIQQAYNKGLIIELMRKKLPTAIVENIIYNGDIRFSYH